MSFSKPLIFLVSGIVLSAGIFATRSFNEKNDKNTETENEQVFRQLATLEAETLRQGDLVQDLRKDLTVLIQNLGSWDLGSINLSDEETFRKFQAKLDQLEQDQNQLQLHLRKLQNTPPKDLIETAAGIKVPENQVTSYLSAYRSAEEQVGTMIASGLSADHPDVKTKKHLAKDALEHANKEVVTLKEVLNIRLLLVEKQIEKITKMLRERKDSFGKISSPKQNYRKAKEKYLQARERYHEMKIQLQELRDSLPSD